MDKLKALFLSTIIALAVAAIAFAWTNPGANPPTGGGALYYSGGNVGIGTAAPKAALHLNGGIIIGNYTSKPTCDSNTTGMLVFDATNNKPYVCANSSTWKPVFAY